MLVVPGSASLAKSDNVSGAFNAALLCAFPPTTPPLRDRTIYLVLRHA